MIRFALALFLLAPVAASAQPWHIFEAEKFACEAVADYLARGPMAIVERLSPKSPFRTVPPETREAEIEARLGPSAGARWELRSSDGQLGQATFHVVFPSGAEDVLTIHLDQVDRTKWQIHNIVTLGETDGLAQYRRHEAMNARASAVEITGAMRWAFILGPVLAFVSLFTRKMIPRSSKLILLSGFVLFAVPFAAWMNPPWLRRIIHRQLFMAPEIIPMAELVDLRRAMAAGGEIRYPEPKNQDAADIASLWAASLAPPGDVEKHLGNVKSLTRSPLLKLIQSRLAAAAGRHQEAVAGYRSIGSATRDAFWDEEAIATDLLDSRQSFYQQTGPMNDDRSRDASIWYSRAIRTAAAGNAQLARKQLAQGWRLMPIPRGELLDMRAFQPLLADPAMATVVDFRTPEERAQDAGAPSDRMTVPAGATATVTGSFLRVGISDARLDVPGGAMIAPAGTTALSATAFERAERADALRLVDRMKAPPLDSAAIQRTVGDAVAALAERNRWDRIIELTDAITTDARNVPLPLVRWRIDALIRKGRSEEARQLASSGTLERSAREDKDAYELIHTSHLLARAGAWSDAIAMLSRASSIEGTPDVTLQYQQFQFRRTLAESQPVASTRHFDIHASPDVAAAVALRIGDLLEAELARLTPRFGLLHFNRVRVNLLPWRLFFGLTGSFHILGFYDGEITIPFGNVERFREDVVAILTHELTHAIVDQVTGGAAPRWFDEGLGKRMELVERQDNIFAARAPGQIMALELLDAFINSRYSGDDVGEAYITSHTFVRFLEDRYGERAVNDLLASYARGNDTADALLEVTKLSVPDLDREFRRWGLTNAGAFIDTTPWPYGRYYSVGIDPKVLEGIRWSRPKSNR